MVANRSVTHWLSKPEFVKVMAGLAICIVGNLLGVDQLFAQVVAEQKPADAIAVDEPIAKSANPNDEPFGGVTAESSGEEEAAEPGMEPLDENEAAEVHQAIEQLGATQFAERERAATKLLVIGKRAIPEMQKSIEHSTDPETRLRIQQVVKQLADGDMQARIKAFLAGQDVAFRGWPVIQRFLGNSITIRELFVEIMQLHPTVGESMDGTTRERAIALESTLAAIQPKLNTIRDEPGRADLFSLLLVALDPDVPLPAAHEQVILRLCQRRLVTDIRRDNNLSGPFSALMNRWILRTSSASREEVLLTGMEMDLSATLPLAVSTLQDTTSVDTLATAFQAITKFGGRQHIPLLETYFDHQGVVGAPALSDDPNLPQLGDIAVIAVAILLKRSTEELGMEKVDLHPNRGFLLPSKVFSEEAEERRQASRKTVQNWMSEEVVPVIDLN